MRIHAFERRSRANGPGVRAVVWFQGCSLGCPGCFNPETHPSASGEACDVDELAQRILAERPAIEGVTFSGGEPLQQPEALLALVQIIRRDGDLSVLIFSGYTEDEIRAQPFGNRILAATDVLIDGRYAAPERHGHGLRGSSNQRICLLSNRYDLETVAQTPEAEVRISSTGDVVITGVNPPRLKQ